MINKIYFGKKIAELRRKYGMSQVELAEKLGVTSQAVSKWECGNAIPDIELLLAMSHFYNVTVNEMFENVDLIFNLTGCGNGHSEINYFTSANESTKNIKWAKDMVENKWIKHNWERTKTANTVLDKVGEEIAMNNGIILEIGAGPGGGFMPYTLKSNPNATIIINDRSPTVVREWKNFLDKSNAYPNIHYAVFDFCNMPFMDNSIDIISDGGGIGNCEGDKAKALKEAYRVLKTGGKLITSTGFVTKETLSSIPIEAQTALLKRRPDIFDDQYEDTLLAGFSKIDSLISGYWYTDDDDSTIATLARSLGVNLKFTSYIRYCTKIS